MTPAEQLVATGPADFVEWLVERWAVRGCRLHPGTGQLVTIGPRSRVLDVADERAALREAGLYYLAPALRLEWRRWYMVAPLVGPVGCPGQVPPECERAAVPGGRRRDRRTTPAAEPLTLPGLDT